MGEPRISPVRLSSVTPLSPCHPKFSYCRVLISPLCIYMVHDGPSTCILILPIPAINMAYTWAGSSLCRTYTLQKHRTYLVPIPLTKFPSNLKLNPNLQCSKLKHTLPITTKLCTHHDSVTVVTCAKYHCDRLSIFWIRALLFLIELRIWSKYHEWDGCLDQMLIAYYLYPK